MADEIIEYRLFSPSRPTVRSRPAYLLNHLTFCQVSRFVRLTGFIATPIRIGKDTVGAWPVGDACSMCRPEGRGNSCRSFATGIIGKMRSNRGAVFDRCPYQKWCGLVPIDCRCSRNLACQVVAASTVLPPTFQERLRMLEEVINELVVKEVQRINEKFKDGEEEPARPLYGAARSDGTDHHIWNAIAYIHENLSWTKLTVASVAKAVKLNATYLAHLFSTHMGIHMRRYINKTRVELSKILLVRTDWQVKTIAFETGHDSPQWFSHIFQVHAGCTPGQYRRRNAHD